MSRPGRRPACRPRCCATCSAGMRRCAWPGRSRGHETALDVASGAAPASLDDLPGQPRAACSGWRSTAAQRLHQLTDDLQLEYDRSAGYMVLLRSEKDRKLVQPGLQVLRDAGVTFREIDADAGARCVEPALNPDTDFAGRDPPARRRSRQLPPVRAAAEERGAGAGRALRVQHARSRRSIRRSRRSCASTQAMARAARSALRCGRGLRRRRLRGAAASARPAACRWRPCTATRSARRSASR